jgi:5-methylcytosine-specific restriction endonuclease McrBC regulatory subunit McrC
MLITVYEHSIINVGKERVDIKDNQQISYKDRDLLLKKIFKDTKQNFSEKRYFQKKNIFEWNNSNTIKTSSIVGTLKIDDELTIEILPKIFNNNIDSDESKKIARKNLIRLVEITKYEDIWDNETEIEEDAENIPYLEFIILRFTTKLLDELQKGIYAQYVTKVEESTFVRGAIQSHLQDIFDKSKVVCKFQELSFDNKLMQIFKTVAEHLLKNSMFSYEIKQNLFEITSILSNVQSLNKLEIFDFENYYFTRLNETYEILFYQAKIIYFEYFPLNSDEDETTPYWAIYFDMDFLFEKFIAHLLSKSGFNVTEQKKIYTYENNYITPDFILYDEEIVIDAKYSYSKMVNKNIFQITNYMDNLNFEGSLVNICNSNKNILFENRKKGKSFNVISLDIGSDFENIVDNFRFKMINNKLDFSFDENTFYENNIEELEKNIPMNFKELVDLSKEYKQNKDWDNAIKCHTELLKKSYKNRDKAFNLNQIGFCFYKNKEINSAEKNFLLSLKEEDNTFAFNFLGKIEFYEKENYENAIKMYTKAIELSEKNNENIKNRKNYYKGRAFVYKKMGDTIKSNRDFIMHDKLLNGDN